MKLTKQTVFSMKLKFGGISEGVPALAGLKTTVGQRAQRSSSNSSGCNFKLSC